MNKKKIVIHIAYAIASISGSILCKQLRYVKNKYSDTHDFILVMSQVKTLRNQEIVEELSGIRFSEVILSHRFWKTCLSKESNYKYNSWKTFYREENWFTSLENVDKIFCFGGLISSQILRSKDSLNDYILARGGLMKYVSASTYISSMLQLLKLSNEKGIEFNEIICDPQETSFDMIRDEEFKCRDHKLWFCYDIPRIGAKRLDYIQSADANAKTKEKVLDFCFGSTFVSKYRYAFYDQIEPLLKFFEDNFRTKLFIYHNKKDINTVVSHDEYQDFISQSRFTLIIPSYDVRTFSMLRFYESVSRGCLPLILDNVFVEDFRDSFGIDQCVIDEITISTSINSINITEPRRIELLSYLYSKLNPNK
jgi:hypothetical protein